GNLNIDLGAVERRLTRTGLIGQSGAGQHLGQHVTRTLPEPRVVDVLSTRTRQREPVPDGLDAQGSVSLAHHAERRESLLSGLGLAAEDVCVVELHGSYPGQAAEHARQLGPALAAELG